MASHPPSLRHLKPKTLEVPPTESEPAPLARRPLFPIPSEKPVDITHLHVPQSSRQKTEQEHEIDGLKQLLSAKSEEMIRHDLDHLLEMGRMKRDLARLSAQLSTQREEIHGLKTELHRTKQLHGPVGFPTLDLSDKPFHNTYAPRCSADREVLEILDSRNKRSPSDSSSSQRSTLSPIYSWEHLEQPHLTPRKFRSPPSHTTNINPVLCTVSISPSSTTAPISYLLSKTPPHDTNNSRPDESTSYTDAMVVDVLEPSPSPPLPSSSPSFTLLDGSLPIRVQLHDSAKTTKHLYHTNVENRSTTDLWDLADLNLGPSHPVGGSSNTGFTRKVIGDAFGGQNEILVNWAGSKAKGSPFVAFRRKSNPGLPTQPGEHGIVFTTFPTYKDGSPAKRDLPLFVGERTNDWRLFGVYNTERVGHVFTTDLDLLPPDILDSWVSDTLKSDWGKDWIRAKNEEVAQRALLARADADTTVISFTQEGLHAALRSGVLRIEFTVLQCVGYDQEWYHRMLHAQLHPKQRVKPRKRPRSMSIGGETAPAALPAKKRRGDSVGSATSTNSGGGGDVFSEQSNVDVRLRTDDHEDSEENGHATSSSGP